MHSAWFAFLRAAAPTAISRRASKSLNTETKAARPFPEARLHGCREMADVRGIGNSTAAHVSHARHE
jgi:hypothetical protein